MHKSYKFIIWIHIYGKCSKIANTSLFSDKMLVIKAGNSKMLARIANGEDPDQTASKEAVGSGSALLRPFWQATSVQKFTTYTVGFHTFYTCSSSDFIKLPICLMTNISEMFHWHKILLINVSYLYKYQPHQGILFRDFPFSFWGHNP